MPKPPYRRRWAWVDGHRAVEQESIADVEQASYALSRLADLGLITTRQLADFQDATGLADFAWRVFWNKSALGKADHDLRSLMRRTQGFVIFMHSWGTSPATWDPLPALVCAANPRLVSLIPDLNGFGGSPFLSEIPPLDKCDPYAVMQTTAYWIEMLGLRSSPRARQRRRVMTFVAHSMSAVALFYFRDQDWFDNEHARCAITPALLGTPTLWRQFYKALGLDVSPGNLGSALEKLKTQLPSSLVENLLRGTNQTTQTESLQVFESTPTGTLAQTFYAIGARRRGLETRQWPNFQVILGHDDHLIQVSAMLDFLDELGFAPDQIQVVMGDHYLFSVSDQNRRLHMRNREILLGEILYLHEQCREKQTYAGEH